jgi:hypothetical protein
VVNALSVEVIHLASRFQEITPGLSASRGSDLAKAALPEPYEIDPDGESEVFHLAGNHSGVE